MKNKNWENYPLKKFIWSHPGLHQLIKKMRYRAFSITNFSSERNLLQLPNLTWMDRRAGLFDKTAELIGKDGHSIKILSFGCSSGEEVFTLRKTYSNATIYGTDINRKCIRKAKGKNSNNKNIFFISNEKNINEKGPYKLIVANSVFIKNPECNMFDRIDQLFPFETFERIIRLLDSQLEIGGLLVLYLTNYRFMDTSVYHKYIAEVDPNIIEDRVPIFNRTGEKLKNEYYDEVIFRKIK